MNKKRIALFCLGLFGLAAVAGLAIAPAPEAAAAAPAFSCEQNYDRCLGAGLSQTFCEFERFVCQNGSGSGGSGGSGGGPGEPSCYQIFWRCRDLGYPLATCERALEDCQG